MRSAAAPYRYEVDAQAVRERMAELDVTASDVCAAVGMNPTAMSDLINGRTKNPTSSRLMLLCDALDVDPIDIMRRVDED